VFHADSPPTRGAPNPPVALTCFLDFATTGPTNSSYEILLYWHARTKVHVLGYGPLVPITLLDGQTYYLQSFYISVDWWTQQVALRTYLLQAVRYNRSIDGHVGLGFFPSQTIAIDVFNSETVVR
jgi:hypothetical protein